MNKLNKNTSKTKNNTKKPVKTHEIFTFNQINKLFCTYWIGSTLGIATLIIPLIFKNLDQITAANITGQILKINACIGMATMIIALLNAIHISKLNFLQYRKFWYAILIEILLAVNYFVLYPLINKLRNGLIDLTNKSFLPSTEFNLWHSLSMIVFLLCCLLSVIYLFDRD